MTRDKLVSIQTAAMLVGISVRHLPRFKVSNNLRTVDIKGKTFFYKSDLIRLREKRLNG